MASASTEVGPFFATPHHTPIELPEQVLAMIVLLLRDSTSAAAVYHCKGHGATGTGTGINRDATSTWLPASSAKSDSVALADKP